MSADHITAHQHSTARFGSVHLVAFLAGLAAVLDFTVRVSSAAWTESPAAQWAVYLSPTLYIALFTALILKLSTLPPKLSTSSMRSMAIALCVCSIVILVQILTRGRSVGNANYSLVLPLFVSGVPLAVLTFIVFFRSSRGPVASAIVAVVAILWILMPMGIDTMYARQGGYRGPSGPFQFAVLGTTYDFLQALAAWGLFVSLLAAPVIFLGGTYLAARSPRSERLCVISVALSLLALSIEFWNWGSFVWD